MNQKEINRKPYPPSSKVVHMGYQVSVAIIRSTCTIYMLKRLISKSYGQFPLHCYTVQTQECWLPINEP